MNYYLYYCESWGWGIVSFCMPGAGEYASKKRKNDKSLGVCLGQMVTVGIEPYIFEVVQMTNLWNKKTIIAHK